MNASDLSERYNDGIKPIPDISKDIFKLPRPQSSPPTTDQIQTGRRVVAGLLVLSILLLSACLASIGYMVVWLVQSW